MQKGKYFLFLILLFVFIVAACSAQPTQVQPAPPTQIINSGSGITPGDLPLNEAEVLRVSVEEARAALENGTAVIVDVRSSSAFEASHIAGAVSVPLGEIERNPTELPLDKNRWIITYCT